LNQAVLGIDTQNVRGHPRLPGFA